MHLDDGSNGPTLPDDSEAAELLDRLGVDAVDRAATLSARPDPVEHPELWSMLDRRYRNLLDTMGRPMGAGLPALPASTGPVGGHLYVWMFLAVLPYVRRYHEAVDVPESISWASLAALGDEMRSTRTLTGHGGLDSTWGLPLVFRGASYRLGRLAFDRQSPRPEETEHAFLATGSSGLNTHVPSGGGSLHPDACDESFALAREFFPKRFPERVVGFGCHSWLMDDQLAAYLPETSNIIGFQRRFEVFVDVELADWAPLEHLFHRRFDGPHPPAELLDALPQNTTLQRAIITHLRGGGHWYNRTGWTGI